MIKEIPILFSTPMVLANLEGRKSKTRRLLKLKYIPVQDIASVYPDGAGTGWIAWAGRAVSAEETKIAYPGDEGFKCPYGKLGDLLWVRENFRVNSWVPDDGELTFRYEADGAISPFLNVDTILSDGEIFNRYWEQSCDDLLKAGYKPTDEESFVDYDYKALRLRPNIFLPKVAARIWLQVTDVRVERLQDITPADAIAEGIKSFRPVPGDGPAETQYFHYLKDKWGPSPVHSFETLWRKINGIDSWEANPWVWVISYNVLSTTGKPDLTTIKA